MMRYFQYQAPVLAHRNESRLGRWLRRFWAQQDALEKLMVATMAIALCTLLFVNAFL